MLPLVLAATVATTAYRVVPLACRDGRLALAGGIVVRLDPAVRCAAIVPGRALAIAVDAAGSATVVPLEPAARPAAELPARAIVFAPSAAAVAAAGSVDLTIEVVVPPRTPAGSAIYLSTERTAWSPAEVRLDQVDARRFRLRLTLPAGTQLAFRITRGSFETTERDAAGRLPPAHVATAAAGAVATVTIAGWADDT